MKTNPKSHRRQAVDRSSLAYLNRNFSPKSHRRQAVDRSFHAYCEIQISLRESATAGRA
jgi:hypothetical protein